jgi:hypothetical protein
MSFFEVFEPGLRHWREYKELEKVKLVDAPAPGPGPVTVDLDEGTVVFEEEAEA